MMKNSKLLDFPMRPIIKAFSESELRYVLPVSVNKGFRWNEIAR